MRELADGRTVSWSADGTVRIWAAEPTTFSKGLVGVSVKVPEGGRLTVEALIENGAAEEAGILPGDVILSIDGKGTEGLSLQEGVDLLGGPPGESVHLVVARQQRPGIEPQTQEIEIAVSRKSFRYVQTLMSFEGHSSQVRGAFPLHDGKMLSWSFDGTVRTWDPDTGREFLVLEGHMMGTYGALPIAPDRVVSWDGGGTLRYWDLETGQLVTPADRQELKHALGLSSEAELPSWEQRMAPANPS